jgi:hypothetical protein
MKIYLFETKKASAPFLKAFSSRHEHKIFNAVEESTAKGKGADRFYHYNFPTWDGEIPEDTTAAFQGLVRGTKEIHEVCISENRDYYYFDQPYFFCSDYEQSDTGDRWYRICKNNTQKNYIEKSNRVNQRYESLVERIKDRPKVMEQIMPKPWQYDGKHILVIPPSYHTAKWYGIDRLEWEKDVIKKIARHDRTHPIVVRQKFKNRADWGEKLDKPLSEDLKNCYAIVSFHSMCAVHAVMAGVPSFCSVHSPAHPVSLGLNELDQIKDPLYAGDRNDWLKSLLCAQFTVEEMQSGFAYGYLNGENVC